MIKIKDLQLSFKDQVIFKDFSLTLQKGEKLAITGESGIGKSTLLNLLTGFIPDFKGDVLVAGIRLNSENINKIREKIAWLPQEMGLSFNTVSELLFAPFEFEINKKNKPSKEEIVTLFDEFKLSESLLNKKLKEISGGQKQRILLISCLLQKKPLLLLDEPTSALDKKIKEQVANYIFKQKELTVIAVTHDEYWIEKSEKVIELRE